MLWSCLPGVHPTELCGIRGIGGSRTLPALISLIQQRCRPEPGLGRVPFRTCDRKGAAVKDLIDDIEKWQEAGRRVALARVVAVIGSGPRDPGAAMAVSDQGEVAGSVSGGCVEGAVVAEALEVLASGEPRLCTFGYSDEEAFSVGLTCGGTVRIFVEPLA